MITFSWGLVLCLGCKHTQTSVSDEPAYGVRLADVTCERCRQPGCAWLARAGTVATRALAEAEAVAHPPTMPVLHDWQLGET